MSVTASIVVRFGDSAGGSKLIAELDDVENNEKTSFLIDETAYFTIYKYPESIVVDTPFPTAGMVNYSRLVARTKTERLDFIDAQSVELAYPPAGPVTVDRWYGNAGSGFAISGYTASITSSAPCICDVTYNAIGYMWRLFPPAIDITETPTYPIIVLVTGDDA